MTTSPTAASPCLLLRLRLPPGTSSRRVAVWRRLRRLGAAGFEGSVYLLPASAENRESFEWLRSDVLALGGVAELFEARRLSPPEGARRRAAGSSASLDPARFAGRTWVTRPRPGVDRMASAWLIRTFVDPRARFVFAGEDAAVPRGAVPFDTWGAEFGHHDGLCTFEILARRFRLDRPGIRRLAPLVRALDLGEDAPDAAEAALVGRLIEGLRAAHADDGDLLAAGIALFAGLAASGPTPSTPAARRRASGARAETGARSPRRRR